MIVRICIAVILLTLSVDAQKLPDKIRGYKVYHPKPAVTKTVSSAATEPAILNASKFVSISPLGVTFEAAISIQPMPEDGRVDFLTFHDFNVNGISVEIEEYKTPFDIRKNERPTLPEPVRIFLYTPKIAQAAWSEMRDSKHEWTVTGRVFVFGRFKRYGMTFKRVVPVDISFTIRNPLRQ